MVVLLGFLAVAYAKPSVSFYILTDCPISRKYVPEINSIVKDYGSRVDFRLVVVGKDATPAVVDPFCKEYGLGMPRLLDTAGAVAKKYKVSVVPTAVLVGGGEVRYSGRIDDRFPTLGVQRKPQRRDLRIAIDEVLAGKTVSVPTTTAVGCVLSL